YDLRKLKRHAAFLVKEVAFNTIYACDLRALSALCAAVDLPDRAAHYQRSAERVGSAILRLMYDDETAAFYDVRTGTNATLKVLTAMSLFPAAAARDPQRDGRRGCAPTSKQPGRIRKRLSDTIGFDE